MGRRQLTTNRTIKGINFLVEYRPETSPGQLGDISDINMHEKSELDKIKDQRKAIAINIFPLAEVSASCKLCSVRYISVVTIILSCFALVVEISD